MGEELAGSPERVEAVRSGIELYASGAAAKAAWALQPVADAAERDAARWLAYAVRARAALRAGQKDDAREALILAGARAAALGPRARVHATLLAADLTLRLGDHAAAAEALRQAGSLAVRGFGRRQRGALELAHARLASAEGRADEALRRAQHALAHDPQPALLFMAARALPQRGADAARDLYRMAAAAGPWRLPAVDGALFDDLLDADAPPRGLESFVRLRGAPASPEQLRELDLLAEARPRSFAPRVAKVELLTALDRLPEARDLAAQIGEETVPPEVASRLRALADAAGSGFDRQRGPALSGELGHFPFAELLSFLASGRFSGTLRLDSHDAVSARVTLVDGKVTGGDRDGDLPFGRALEALGWEVASARQGASASLASEALAAGLAPDDVEAALRVHVVRALAPAMGWSEGRFAFAPGEARRQPFIGLEAAFVLLECARREDEGQRRGGGHG
ncbi:MAG: DUF4388 domain-containing protein [Myxococcota bacterium]